MFVFLLCLELRKFVCKIIETLCAVRCVVSCHHFLKALICNTGAKEDNFTICTVLLRASDQASVRYSFIKVKTDHFINA